MGKIEKGYLGGFSGILCTAVGSKWKGKSVVKSRPPRKRTKPSTEQGIHITKFMDMKPIQVMSVGELKTNFSEVLKRVQSGEEIGIVYGKNKVVVARLVPKNNAKKMKRKIGILDGKGKVKFSKNFKLTKEEFRVVRHLERVCKLNCVKK